MTHRTVTATEFKAKCLAMLDEVEQGAVRITVTRRGKPVAILGPHTRTRKKSPEGTWAKRLQLPDDFEKWDFSDLWEGAESGVDKS